MIKVETQFVDDGVHFLLFPQIVVCVRFRNELAKCLKYKDKRKHEMKKLRNVVEKK